MTASAWCYTLAALAFIKAALLLAIPQKTGALMKALPTDKTAGAILTTIAWIWAAITLNAYPVDFLAFVQGPLTFIIAIICIPLSIFLMPDQLASRALSALYMLYPMPMILATRDAETAWRLLPITLGYISLTFGMVIMFYPWHLRRLIFWVADRRGAMLASGLLSLLTGAALCAAALALAAEAAQ